MNITSNLGRYEAFKLLIEKYNCKIGVEVGTRESYFTEYLAANTNLELIYGIDIVDWPEMHKCIARHPNKIKFLLRKSPEAANCFEDNYFDFIHLDSWHSYEHVRDELIAFWPKLKSGGVFSGDDFMEINVGGEGYFGVIQAVTEFVKSKNLQIYLTGCSEIELDKQIKYGKLKGSQRAASRIGVQEIPNWWLIKP